VTDAYYLTNSPPSYEPGGLTLANKPKEGTAMKGKLNIKLYGFYAQLFIGSNYVGTITYDEHKVRLHQGWTEHTFSQKGEYIAKIDARGAEHGTS